jgi:Co/Zn/Cd efflux system component
VGARASDDRAAGERRTLGTVLAINLAQSVVGAGVGFWSGSTALLGAALDNLADAGVYGVSLYAVGRGVRSQVFAARLSGWLLIGLAAGLVVEVLRRYFGGEPPIGPAMMAMAAANAIVNQICLRLLARQKGGGVTFKASAIFTSNDSIANAGIVLSGALVMWLDSNVPDLLLGLVVAGIAAHGGREILEEAGKTARERSEAPDS